MSHQKTVISLTEAAENGYQARVERLSKQDANA